MPAVPDDDPAVFDADGDPFDARVDPLRSFYDERTLAALDRHDAERQRVKQPERTATGFARGAGGAAFLAAAMVGVREVLEPERDEPIVEEIDVDPFGSDLAPVIVYFVPNAPKATRVLCRPWLLQPR